MLYRMTDRLKYVEKDWFRDVLTLIAFFLSKLRLVSMSR